jgi:hypothetical protein
MQKTGRYVRKHWWQSPPVMCVSLESKIVKHYKDFIFLSNTQVYICAVH